MTNGRHQPLRPPEDGTKQQKGRARVPRAAGKGSRRILLVAGAVGLCAIATGVSLAVFSSPSGQAGHVADAVNSLGAATAGTAQPTPPVASSTTGPNVTTNGLAKSALQYPSGLKDPILSWKAGRGGKAWSAVTLQLGNVTQSSGLQQLYPQLRLDCVSLGSMVQTARSAPPIPDALMQQLYAKALVSLARTAVNCQNAITVHPVGDEGTSVDLNKPLLNRSLAEFVAESKQLYTATAEIRTLG